MHLFSCVFHCGFFCTLCTFLVLGCANLFSHHLFQSMPQWASRCLPSVSNSASCYCGICPFTWCLWESCCPAAGTGACPAPPTAIKWAGAHWHLALWFWKPSMTTHIVGQMDGLSPYTTVSAFFCWKRLTLTGGRCGGLELGRKPSHCTCLPLMSPRCKSTHCILLRPATKQQPHLNTPGWWLAAHTTPSHRYNAQV